MVFKSSIFSPIVLIQFRQFDPYLLQRSIQLPHLVYTRFQFASYLLQIRLKLSSNSFQIHFTFASNLFQICFKFVLKIISDFRSGSPVFCKIGILSKISQNSKGSSCAVVSVNQFSSLQFYLKRDSGITSNFRNRRLQMFSKIGVLKNLKRK